MRRPAAQEAATAIPAFSLKDLPWPGKCCIYKRLGWAYNMLFAMAADPPGRLLLPKFCGQF